MPYTATYVPIAELMEGLTGPERDRGTQTGINGPPEYFDIGGLF